MRTTSDRLLGLTAADLQTRVVVKLHEGTPLREAAQALLEAGVHGAPVVNAAGRCVGVLSVSDLTRWAVHQSGPAPTQPKTCNHQETHRAVGGEETTRCTLPPGACSIQTPLPTADGRAAQVCREPHAVCLDWQMVEVETLPAEDVRHYMTADPVTCPPGTRITVLARQMIDAAVQRVIVTDAHGRPVGVVSTTDLVAALATADEI